MMARTPREVASAIRRELDVRSQAVATERALRAAGRSGAPLLLGPFIGEIGYELSLDPRTPIVIGVYPMRPIPRG